MVANTKTIVGPGEAQHLVLRPILSVKLLLGFFGVCGLAVSIAALVSAPLSLDSAFAFALGLASIAFGLFYATTEIHATSSRFWLRRYGLTVWSIPMSRAGTTEGTDADWRLIYVIDLISQKQVGAINWWILDAKERVRLAEFVDRSREELGVTF